MKLPRRNFLHLATGSNRLDVVHAAPIPIGAEPTATRCGEMIE
jgi:hypothetical protein